MAALAVVAAVAVLSFALPTCRAPEAEVAAGDTALVPADIPAKSDDDTITLLMAGDMVIHDYVWESGERADGTLAYDHLFAPTRDLIAAADFAIVNQETVLGGTELGLADYPCFNSPQELGDAEAAAGFDVVLTATNHSMDSGYEALAAEHEFFRSRHPEMQVVGTVMPGEALASESGPVILEKGDFKVAVLNYTYDLNGFSDPMDAVCLLDEAQVRHGMELANAQADIVVVCPHWGIEYEYQPDETQRYWAQLFCDLGADVIIGSHPHVIEPVEVIEGEGGQRALVFWSTGNFISNCSSTMASLEGIAQVTLKKDGQGARVGDWSFTPVVMHREPGTAMAAYPLAQYTEELAARAAAASEFADTLESYRSTAAEVLGSAYDPAACVLRGSME